MSTIKILVISRLKNVFTEAVFYKFYVERVVVLKPRKSRRSIFPKLSFLVSFQLCVAMFCSIPVLPAAVYIIDCVIYMVLKSLHFNMPEWLCIRSTSNCFQPVHTRV